MSYVLARAVAMAAAHEMLSQEQNVLANSFAWRVVSAALDAYEDEWARVMLEVETRLFVVSRVGRPLIAVETRRLARYHRRRLARLADEPRLLYTITEAIGYLQR